MPDSADYDALQVGDEVLVYVAWESEVGRKRVGQYRVPVTIPAGDAWCRITKVREANKDGFVWYEVEAVDPVGANVGMVRHDRIKNARPAVHSTGSAS